MGYPEDVAPFTVECEMDPNQGVTVINNENGGDVSCLYSLKLSLMLM